MNDVVISYGNLARPSSISHSHRVNKVCACFLVRQWLNRDEGGHGVSNPFLASFFFSQCFGFYLSLFAQ